MPASSPLSSTVFEMRSGFSSTALWDSAEPIVRDDALADARDDRLLGGAAHQPVDVRAHGHARHGAQLDAVLATARRGARVPGRHVDDLGLHRTSDRVQHVAPGQVDRARALVAELDVRLGCGDQRLADPQHVAARQVVGLQRIGLDGEPRLGRHDAGVHDDLGIDPPQPHADQAQELDPAARQQRPEPQRAIGEERQRHHQRHQADGDDGHPLAHLLEHVPVDRRRRLGPSRRQQPRAQHRPPEIDHAVLSPRFRPAPDGGCLQIALTTTRLPLVSITRTRTPGSSISPRVTTSTRRPPIVQTPLGRQGVAVMPSAPSSSCRRGSATV
ncbi:MAG: hypothetical protein KatS3mg102_1028 [Planctomycetota bacterium]|nr:MAG: hypothetical protein KatS3mg102_1028 [Planctomycetota bacterium]